MLGHTPYVPHWEGTIDTRQCVEEGTGHTHPTCMEGVTVLTALVTDTPHVTYTYAHMCWAGHTHTLY